jgi:hypothetical protein
LYASLPLHPNYLSCTVSYGGRTISKESMVVS